MDLYCEAGHGKGTAVHGVAVGFRCRADICSANGREDRGPGKDVAGLDSGRDCRCCWLVSHSLTMSLCTLR